MAINIQIADKVKIKVAGTIKNEQGVDEKFDFWLICERLDTDDIQTLLKEDSDGATLADFLATVVQDWTGVKSGSEALDYSEASLRALCKIPGIAGLAFRAYMEEVGAKAKN